MGNLTASYVERMSKTAEEDPMYNNGRPQQLDTIKALEQLPGFADITSGQSQELRAWFGNQGELRWSMAPR